MAMTETTATRLAAATEDARKAVRQTAGDYEPTLSVKNGWPQLQRALTRLEALCVAQGRWEEHLVEGRHGNYSPAHDSCALEEAIEALLREETPLARS